jgi:outer membrane protein
MFTPGTARWAVIMAALTGSTAAAIAGDPAPGTAVPPVAATSTPVVGPVAKGAPPAGADAEPAAAAEAAAPPAATATRSATSTEGAAADPFHAAMDALLGQPGGLTADGAAARAAKASPSVRRKAAEVALAYAQGKKTELVRVPRLGVSAKYTRLSDVDPPGIPGFDSVFPVLLNQMSLDATLSVPISDYVLTFPSLLKAAKQGEAAARLAERDAVIAAEHEARLAYYEWVRANLQVVVARQLVVQVDANVARMQALIEVKAITRADLLRVQAQAAAVKQTLAQLESLRHLREQQLRILIDAGAEEQLAIGEDIRVDLPAWTPPTVDELVATASGRRLDLKTLDAGIEARTLQRTATAAGKYPKLSAFASATYANPNQRIFPSREEFDFTWAAGLSLSWTVNDFLGTKSDVDIVDAEAAQLTADRERLLDGVRLELESATTAHVLAQTAKLVSVEGLAAAEEGRRLRLELLALQRATGVEVVDAETELTRARISALDAQIDERVARLRLRHATGEDVP